MKKMSLTALFVLTILLAFPAHAAGLPFTDVPEDAWYYRDVYAAWESGLISGATADTFAPDDSLTCAEAVKLAACMHQLYTEGEITLSGGDPWYLPYAEYAAGNGIITAVNSYDPDAVIDRSRFSAVFAEALPEGALSAVNDIPDGTIRDVPKSAQNSEAVYTLYRAGILQGSGSDHRFYPSRPITRAEVSAVLTRMMHPEKRLSFRMEPSADTAEYKTAFAAFLSSYEETYGEDGETYVFDLIYADSGTIPELVVAAKNKLARECGVRVFRWCEDGSISAAGTYGSYGTLTYFPNNGLIWDAVTGGSEDAWIASTALKTPTNPPQSALILRETVSHETQSVSYSMFLPGSPEWTELTKEEYDAQYQALEEFRNTESVTVHSRRMYELNEENIASVLG